MDEINSAEQAKEYFIKNNPQYDSNEIYIVTRYLSFYSYTASFEVLRIGDDQLLDTVFKYGNTWKRGD